MNSSITITFFGPKPFAYWLILLGVILSPLTVTFAQAQDAVTKRGNSVVRGRVLFADSEQPLRRATVRLRKELNLDFLQRAITGKRGEFGFQGVAAGTYYLEVDAPGVISLTTGPGLSDLGFAIDETNLTLVTVDGTNEVKTEVRVKRGGAINGRVSYSDGEPATNAQIVLFWQKGQNLVPFIPDDPILTDDRGAYRIEGLPQGKYLIGAKENHAGGPQNTPANSPGLVTAYHPASPSVGTASVINLQAGSELREVNISFAQELWQLSGTIKWKQNNAPVKQASVLLRRVSDPQTNLDYQSVLKMMTPVMEGGIGFDLLARTERLSVLRVNSPTTEADDKGNWSFKDVPPGMYSVAVEAPVPVDETEKRKAPKQMEDPIFNFGIELPDFSKGMLRGIAEVTVKDKNVENVSIELNEGGRISGSVVVDGDTEFLSSVYVNVLPVNPLLGTALPEPIKDDLTFELRSVPAGNVRLDISQAGASYYIRSITGKGVNLLYEPLTLSDQEPVTGVQLVLGTDTAVVEGRVVAASGGGTVAGAGIALLPADQRKWPIRSFWGVTRADADGKFALRLAPGEYVALAWSPVNEPTASIESHVRTHLTTARRITLQPNETKAIELQVSTKPVE